MTEAAPPPATFAPAPACPRCNYDLTAAPGEINPVCPECGYHWTIDELARQHLAREPLYTSWGGRIHWAVGPSLYSLIFLFVGLVFGPPVLYACVLIILAFLGLNVSSWWRDLRQISYRKGRTEFGRRLWVALCAALLLSLNIALLFGLAYGAASALRTLSE